MPCLSFQRLSRSSSRSNRNTCRKCTPVFPASRRALERFLWRAFQGCVSVPHRFLPRCGMSRVASRQLNNSAHIFQTQVRRVGSRTRNSRFGPLGVHIVCHPCSTSSCLSYIATNKLIYRTNFLFFFSVKQEQIDPDQLYQAMKSVLIQVKVCHLL